MVVRLRKAALWAFGNTMPNRAALWFERAVLTPGRRMAADPAGAISSRLPYGNGWLQLWEWPAPAADAPTALLLHGWGSSTARVAPLVGPMQAAGYRVVAWDAPAHGRSLGTRTNMIECAGAALLVGGHVGPISAVVAHSFGAPTVALAAQYGLLFDRLAMLGPPQNIMGQTIDLGVSLGVPRHVAERMAVNFARRLAIDLTDFHTDRMIASLDLPMLVIHDRDDRTVPYAHGAAVARAARNGEFMTTEGLDHRGILDDAAVHGRLTRFLRG